MAEMDKIVGGDFRGRSRQAAGGAARAGSRRPATPRREGPHAEQKQLLKDHPSLNVEPRAARTCTSPSASMSSTRTLTTRQKELQGEAAGRRISSLA